MKNIIVYDIDGTISDGAHRQHLLPREEDMNCDKAWLKFNKACIDDDPIEDICDLYRELYCSQSDYEMILLTGRGEGAREETIAWCDKHHIWYHQLIMRPEGDCRRGYEFKKEVLESIGPEKIWMSFEDLDRNVEMMRELGITTVQVATDEGQYG